MARDPARVTDPRMHSCISSALQQDNDAIESAVLANEGGKDVACASRYMWRPQYSRRVRPRIGNEGRLPEIQGARRARAPLISGSDAHPPGMQVGSIKVDPSICFYVDPLLARLLHPARPE
jgi:hypothetical protein